MFIYNILTELLASQALMVIGALVVVFVFEILLLKEAFDKKKMHVDVLKQEISFKDILMTIVLSLVIVLLIGLIGRGYSSGSMFVEKFGWPIEYFTVYRNTLGGDSIQAASVSGVNFDVVRFGINLLLFGLLSFNIIWILSIKKISSIKKSLVILTLVIFTIGSLIAFSIYNKIVVNNSKIADKKISVVNLDIARQKRNVIESKYPDFKDFEKVQSFAGQEVTSVVIDDIYYFAYIVNGSGVPVIKATCFSVDIDNAVKMTEYTNDYSSLLSTKLDPQTCRMFKR